MSSHGLRYLANCSLLFAELPLLERPAAARAAPRMPGVPRQRVVSFTCRLMSLYSRYRKSSGPPA